MYFSKQEVDEMFKEAGVIIADNECENDDNHIAPAVLEYLENKWEKGTKENETHLMETAKKLLKDFDD